MIHNSSLNEVLFFKQTQLSKTPVSLYMRYIQYAGKILNQQEKVQVNKCCHCYLLYNSQK